MKQLYMSAIVPPAELAEKIRRLQREFADKYGSAAALKPPVHITFGPPEYLDEAGLERYVRLLDSVAGGAHYFSIVLNGFGFFVKNKVLFVKAKAGKPIFELYLRFNPQRAMPDSRPYHPHITIGYRKILPATFVQIMKDYKERLFEGKFIASGLQLWQHTDECWQAIKEFPFPPPGKGNQI